MNRRATSRSKLYQDNLSAIRFPIRVPLESDESGRGYVLRLCALNSLDSLGDRALMAKLKRTNLSELDAQFLSNCFGENELRLRWALGADYSLTDNRRTVFAGHQLARFGFINRTKPRVCPQCLLQNNLCRFSWEFSLVTACHQHRLSLIDRCDSCLKSIRWARPAPITCNCFAPLSHSLSPHQPKTVELEFEQWVELQSRLKSSDSKLSLEATGHQRTVNPSSALMQMIWPLSLNAGLLITHALSTAAGSALIPHPSSRQNQSQLQRAQAALHGANELAVLIREKSSASMHIGASKKAFELIAACLTHDFSPADRSFAQSLLSTLSKRYKTQRWSSAKPQLSQLLLF